MTREGESETVEVNWNEEATIEESSRHWLSKNATTTMGSTHLLYAWGSFKALADDWGKSDGTSALIAMNEGDVGTIYDKLTNVKVK